MRVTLRQYFIRRPKTPSAPLWRPATQTEYMYMDGEWVELGTVSFTYDERGNAILELVEGEDGSTKTEKTYDDYNQVLTSLQSYSEDGTALSVRPRASQLLYSTHGL